MLLLVPRNLDLICINEAVQFFSSLCSLPLYRDRELYRSDNRLLSDFANAVQGMSCYVMSCHVMFVLGNKMIMYKMYHTVGLVVQVHIFQLDIRNDPVEAKSDMRDLEFGKGEEMCLVPLNALHCKTI